ncbi:MAG: GNAT family N-acetyltransferase [Bacteroidetes bacterium]|nr:GNAT family N-acetyltransferase [Bacteroidota bacterium]
MKLNYRIATQKEVELIAKLAESIWRKYYITFISIEQIDFMIHTMYSSESLKKQMKEGHKFTLVYNKDNPIGYISLSTKDKKNFQLNKFYIETADHRKGVGSLLFNYILNSIPLAETIELTVNRQNYKAINFYFKNGFVIKEVADFDIGNGFFMNDFVMVKRIKHIKL